jgi:CDP-glycerol glycerophosphotransferase (TagB/SpsB family)
VLLDEGRVVAAAPVIFEQVTPLHWEWSTTDRITPVGKLRLGDKGFLALELTINSVMNTSVARASEVRRGTTASVRISPWRREGLHLESRAQGIVGWRIIRRSAFSLAAGGIRKAWFRLPGTRALAGRWQHLLRETGPKVARRLGEYLPDRNAYVISSDHGRQFTGHPRAIAEYLQGADTSARLCWLGSPSAAGVPGWVTQVDPHTIRGAWRIARASSWIDDFGIDTSVRKSRHTKYLQTWHGIALKRVGSDTPDWPLISPRLRLPRPANRDRWDALMSPSEFFSQTTARAIGFDGLMVENCSPFGDAVLRASKELDLRSRLDLPQDRPVIVYAPTGRSGHGESAQLDLAAWWRQSGNEAYLLVRSHPSNPLVDPAKWANGIRDISGEGDLAAFLGSADALITDYSALVFDFARLGRPVAFYAPDVEIFTRRSVGLYLDLVSTGPGPLLRNPEELADWVQTLIEATPLGGFDTDRAGHRDFVSMFAGERDGASAQRAIEALRGIR